MNNKLRVASYEFEARLGVTLLIIATFIIACWTPVAFAGPRNIKVGDAVGAVKLTDIDGKAVDTADWKGSPSVWIFVSAEQASSEGALKDLQEAIDGLTGANVRAVGITADAFALPYFRQLRSRSRIRLPIALDAGREIYGRIGVIVLPTTLLIDKDGKLAHVLSGYDLQYRRQLDAHLAFLAGRINADELKRRLATTQPSRDENRDRAERHCRAAELMLSRGLRTEAAAELQEAIKADPAYFPGYIALAEMKTADGDLPAAEKLIADVTAKDPQNRHAKLALGVVRFHQKKLDEAEKLLNDALVLNPNPAKTHYWLGRLFDAKADPAKAAEHYRAAVEQLLPELRPSKPK